MNRADRLHAILGLFTADRPLWTIEDAAETLGVSLSTAYRQFGALVRSGLLDALEGSRVYVLGPAIIELDRNIRLSDPLITVAKPAMRWLAEQTPVYRLPTKSGKQRVSIFNPARKAYSPSQTVDVEPGQVRVLGFKW